MYGYIYNTETREILRVVYNVKEVGPDYLIGDVELRGLSPTAAIMTTESVYNEGDILSLGEMDKSSQFKSKEQIINELKAENALLRASQSRMQSALDELILGGAL